MRTAFDVGWSTVRMRLRVAFTRTRALSLRQVSEGCKMNIGKTKV